MATEKQTKALENLVGNGGNVTKAMREAGYSEATANTPQKLTESKGWQELVEEYLPDDLLAKVNKEGLEAVRITGEEGSATPDYATRHRYLETALKIKDKFPSKKLDLTSNGKDILGFQLIVPEGANPKEDE